MKRAIILGCAVIACAVACSYHSATPYQPDGQSAIIQELFISKVPETERPFDGGTTIAVRLCAKIPSLQGATHAFMTTSAGTLGGSMPGSQATVTLVQPAGSKRHEGDVLLVLPEGRTARVTAEIGELAATAELAAGAAIPDGGTSELQDPCLRAE